MFRMFCRRAGELTVVLAIMTAAWAAGGDSAGAAVVFRHRLGDNGPFEFYHPLDVAVAKNGEIFVIDTGKHRVVKFTPDGDPLITFGREGSGRGQLYYPEALTIGENPVNGKTLVYVADTANSRIMVFDDQGRFVRQIGELGAAEGQLDHPNGIALLRNDPGSDIFVTEERNNRVSRFSWNGVFKDIFDCKDCPGGQFHVPAGIDVRKGERADLVYVVDVYSGQVHVLRMFDGSWFRSFGSRGTGPGQMEFADEIAVDNEGNAFVVDSSVNADRVSKFDPAGKFLYSFSSSGSVPFNQPHGVALDAAGNIYVVNTSESDVYSFSEEPAKLTAPPEFPRARWLSDKSAWFNARYNGVEQTCVAHGTATIVARPRGGTRTFNLTSDDVVVGRADVPMTLSDSQTTWIGQTWARGKVITVTSNFKALCQDGKRFKYDRTTNR